MAAFVVNEAAVRAFKTLAALEKWYAANHERASELWIKIHKKGSGLTSVTPAEAIDVALCWGWIDGIRKGFDDKSFLQRFTPRGKRSIWSKVNVANVERLRGEGRMKPPGEAAVKAAQEDGRWDRAYGGFNGDAFPADLLAAIEKSPKARATFATLDAQNRYALGFRTHNMKTEDGRKKKIETFVAMLARGETIHPNSKRTPRTAK